MSVAVLQRRNVVLAEALRKKRLGQYFTGAKVARLLAVLADAQTAEAIIDPMVGHGSMLAGCVSVRTAALLTGIDLDETVLATCRAQLSGLTPHLVCGSAFSSQTLAQLPQRDYDLVITNPPYVRYQSTSASSAVDGIPTAGEVRGDLSASLGGLSALDATDAGYLKTLVRSYSGLSDLAVPSWLLCAALTRTWGTLAMLVPTTWLSRDYAHVVRYVLARWFDVKYVVEDVDGAWFDDALVRTSLVIATRVPRRSSAFAPGHDSGYLHVRLPCSAETEQSIVGQLFPAASDPEAAFAEVLAGSGDARLVDFAGAVRSDWVPASHVAAELASALRETSWLAEIDDSVPSTGKRGAPLAIPIRTVLGELPSRLVTLGDMGWSIGQGLRTGANQFFYVEVESIDDTTAYVRSALGVDHGVFAVPVDAVSPVLRRQSELPASFAIDHRVLTGRVLILDRYADPDDLAEHIETPYDPAPPALANYIRAAAALDVGTGEVTRTVPMLSAVATNVRRATPGQSPRFWYQLPLMRDRHRPVLLLARVNTGAPRTYLNSASTIIDANFSTLWPDEQTASDAPAILALLNSTLCISQFELLGTVLGGGALKLEATHLRRVLVPELTPQPRCELIALGRALTRSAPTGFLPVLDEIDRVVLAALDVSRPHERLDRLRDLVATCQDARSR